MKKRFLRIVSLICLSTFLLSGYGFADDAVFETLELPEDTRSVLLQSDTGADSSVFYAVLYADGTLKFQKTRPAAGTNTLDIVARRNGDPNDPLTKNASQNFTVRTPGRNAALQSAYITIKGQTIKDIALKADYEALYTVSLTESYSQETDTPWYEKRAEIKTVDFADVIQPSSTAYWFSGFNHLEQITNISSLDTSGVADMSFMFNGCEKLSALDVSAFNTANVTNMYGMFEFCENLTELDVSSFDTSRVADMSWMFGYCGNLEIIYASDAFVTAQVTDSDKMFNHCVSLAGGAGTNYASGQDNKTYARIDRADAPGYFTAKSANASNEPPVVTPSARATATPVPTDTTAPAPISAPSAVTTDRLPLKVSVPVTEAGEPLTASNLIGKIVISIDSTLEEDAQTAILIPFFDANDRFLDVIRAKGTLSGKSIGAKVTISRMNGTPAYGKVFIVDQNSNAFLSNTVEFTL